MMYSFMLRMYRQNYEVTDRTMFQCIPQDANTQREYFNLLGTGMTPVAAAQKILTEAMRVLDNGQA